MKIELLSIYHVYRGKGLRCRIKYHRSQGDRVRSLKLGDCFGGLYYITRIDYEFNYIEFKHYKTGQVGALHLECGSIDTSRQVTG
jgi:hypothetical protein